MQRTHLSRFHESQLRVRSEYWRVFSVGFTTRFLRTKRSICPAVSSTTSMSRFSRLCLSTSGRRERKLRCFFDVTTGRTPDRERALVERTFRSSGSFPRVNREHLLWPAIRDLARNRLPFTPTTHGYSASLGIIAGAVKSLGHFDQSRLHAISLITHPSPIILQTPAESRA